MTGGSLTPQDIIQLTLRVGEDWAVAHARRLIALIQIIGADSVYDGQVIG